MKDVLAIITPLMFIASVIALLLPTFGEVVARRPFKWKWSDLTTIGKWFVRVAALFLVLTVAQWVFANRVQDQNDTNKDASQRALFDKQKAAFDSSLAAQQGRFDSALSNAKHSSDSNSKALVVMLAQYGLRVDSANNRLVKEVQKNATAAQPTPVLDFADGNPITEKKEANGSASYQLWLVSMATSSTNFQLKCGAVIETVSGERQFVSDEINTLPKGQIMTSKPISFAVGIIDVPYLKVYFWLRGKFTNIGGSKKGQIDVMIVYDRINKTSVGLKEGSDSKNRIITIIKKG